MNHFKSLGLAAAGLASLANAAPLDDALAEAQPVLDTFYAAVSACDRKPPFKPGLRLATAAGATRYDPSARAVFVVSYDMLDPGRRAAMDRFAAIGTLGLSGRAQYVEVFNTLLVAHELGHWVQEVSRRPLNRWQAEYEANRMMIAFWRDHPSAIATEQRLANFVAQRPGTPDPMFLDTGANAEDFFNVNIARIEADPMQYSLFQKMMVRTAMAEIPRPSFCQTIVAAWPR